MPMRSRTSSYVACFATTCSIVLPLSAHAQIIITEVMYDPAGSDDKQEWIELYNDGADAVDLTKWTFADGSSATKHGLNVPPKNGGKGSTLIPAGGYAVIADDATTFVAAFPSVENVIDSTMSLPNPSAGLSVTVTLYDPDKAQASTFSYVGGTAADGKGGSAQRSASGIIPALPTPGSANATDVLVVADETPPASSGGGTTATTAAAPVDSYVPPPVQTLFADAGADRTEIVGADIAFSGRAYLRNQDVIANVRYHWNFGDGTTAEGESVMHRFAFPGRYVVTLTVAQDKNAGSDRVIVTAEPARLAFAAYADGSAGILNTAGRELDLSRWIIRSGVQQFVIPEGSLILPGSEMRLPQSTLGFWSGPQTELQYPNGVRALGAGEGARDAALPPELVAAPAQPAPAPAPLRVPVRAAAPQSAPAQTPEELPEGPSGERATSSAQAAAAASAIAPRSVWFWSALGLAALGGVAVFAARLVRRDEWEIGEADAPRDDGMVF